MAKQTIVRPELVITVPNPDSVPKLVVRFDKPRYGYWNGGAKSGGEFHPEHYSHGEPHPGAGNKIRWGSWALNFWFVCGSGVSWAAAANIARRFLAKRCQADTVITIGWE